MSNAMANRWVSRDSKASPPRLVRSMDSVEDSVRKNLQAISLGDYKSVKEDTIKQLKKRKLISEK